MSENNTWDMYKSRIPLVRNRMVSLYGEIHGLIPRGVKSVLDFGCGEGHFVNFISDKYARVVGCDLAVDKAKRYYKGLDFRKLSVYDSRFKSEFDCVTNVFVLEHLDNPLLALENIKRATKKYAVIVVPNEPFFEIASKVKNVGRFVGHINFFTRGTLVNILRYFFKVRKVKKRLLYTAVLVEKK